MTRRLTLAALAASLVLAPPAAAHTAHLVTAGETLTGIAADAGVTPAALAAANGMAPDAFVIAGTTLQVPDAGQPAAAAAAPGAGSAASGSAPPPPMGGYTVRPGDTLSGLAARSGIPVAQMAHMNGLAPDANLIAGTQLKLPTGSPVTAQAQAQAAAPAAPAAAPAAATPAAPAAPPVPTATRLGSSRISSIAAEHGVPGSLAAAIAWQESGNNNAMVSSAGARGVMQVMPGTWTWVQQQLAGGRRLDPGSAEDNVRAGSLFLRQLLRETNGDAALAAAGYYQGMTSVRRIGMLPETRQYVNNVLALRQRFGG